MARFVNPVLVGPVSSACAVIVSHGDATAPPVCFFKFFHGPASNWK